MRQLVIRPAANADLEEIGDFIAADNPERARTFVREIIGKIGECAERPYSFRARFDVFPELRSAVHGRYLIFFIPSDEAVEIIRVLHGSRDLLHAFEN